MADPHDPILVIGAGPTGLTAALELARLGVAVRVVDRQAEPSTTSRALAVQARTLELFDQRGLASEMVSLGNKARGAAIFDGLRRIAELDVAAVESRFNFLLMLSQAETERILREHLVARGVSIERPAELIAFSQSGAEATDAVRAVLRHGDGRLEDVRTPYLIDAEGAHATVRRTLRLPFAGVSHKQGFALADLYADGPVAMDEISIHLSEHGFLGIFPMGNGHIRIIGSDPSESTATNPPTLDEMQRLLERVATGTSITLHDLVWSSRFHVNARMLASLRCGNIFFAGDSAHVHSPAGGQGMNTGIQDAIDLAWKVAFVARGDATPKLLDTYDQDRLPVIRRVLSASEGMLAIAASEHPLAHRLVAFVAPLFLSMGVVQRIGGATIAETAVHYRASGISMNDNARGDVKAGDRVPELEVRVAGRETRLADLLDPSRLTLLVAGDGSGALRGLFDGEGELARWRAMIDVRAIEPASASAARFVNAFGRGDGVWLVRPDSYVGFAGTTASVPALRTWLETWFDRA
jgi:2-polyprenyl-6-methoxyphenol hydroxylase-like FAD-dependent oxidoreductase